jgi:hypothetical protein
MAKSFTTMQTMFTTLSQNTTTANTTLAGTLLNDVHRYLLLKYFNNEQSFTMTTIGPQSLTITTSSLASGSTSAILSAAWPYISCQQLVVFSDGEQRTVFFTQGSTSIIWQSPTTAVQTSNAISCVGVQAYPMPANISKLKTASITIGQLVYVPYPVNSVQEWVKLNALPYTAAYPAYFFLYNNQLNFWPIPSNTGQIITLYAQINVPDLSYTDVTGTIASSGMAIGSNIVTATGSPFSVYPQSVDLTFTNLQLIAAPPYGDGLNYQIQNFTSNASATLKTPAVYAPNQGGSGTFTIGQYPLLDGNFHDAIVYGALRTYFSSISKDTDKASYFGGLYQEKIGQMDGYLSTKSVIVDLGTSPPALNPNLFLLAPSSSV